MKSNREKSGYYIDQQEVTAAREFGRLRRRILVGRGEKNKKA